MKDDTVIVYMHHIRKSGMCSGGAREFFTRHGLSWSDFLQKGIPVLELEGTFDAMAQQVCDFARAEHEKSKKG